MDQLCRADHLTAKDQARYQVLVHTHSLVAHKALCMYNSTHTQPGESPNWCQAKLSTRGANKGSYKTFSQPETLAAHRQNLQRVRTPRTARTGRTARAVQPVQNHHRINSSFTSSQGGAGQAPAHL